MGVVVSLEESKRKGAASIAPLVDVTRDAMERVNELILDRAGSDVGMIPEVARHLIDSGGKRLRPMLTIASAAMCGYRGNAHVKLAASVEFMHTATLLHDDVVDESELRRGKLAARMVWGNQASVLVGDFLLGQAFKMMVEVGSLDALDILSNAAAIIAEGEVMQLSAAKNMATTEDEYLAVIAAKTAALFSAAAEVGPTIAGRGRDDRAAFRSYGTNLGLAFQLIDDALDYGGYVGRPRQACRRRFPRGQDHAPRRPLLSPRLRRGPRLLDAGPGRGQDRGRRPRARHHADAPPWRDRGHHRPRPPFRRGRPRRIGAVPGFALALGAARSRRLLHQPGLLSAPRCTRH